MEFLHVQTVCTGRSHLKRCKCISELVILKFSNIVAHSTPVGNHAVWCNAKMCNVLMVFGKFGCPVHLPLCLSCGSDILWLSMSQCFCRYSCVAGGCFMYAHHTFFSFFSASVLFKTENAHSCSLLIISCLGQHTCQCYGVCITPGSG